MSLHTLLHHLEPALAALEVSNLSDSEGLQLFSATTLAAYHHPPLNPDFPAVLLADSAPDWNKLQAALLNQYPAAHIIQLVWGSDSDAEATVLTLDALAGGSNSEGQWIAIFVPPLPQASSFERFQETIAHLRAPEGCPWDRKQTHSSLRPYLLEETYEVLDALDAGDRDDLREELGDLLLQIVLHSQIAVDEGSFRMADIIATINEKIVRRHPHVWGDVSAEDAETVKTNWDHIKQAEKNHTRESRLDGVSKSLPALSQAFSYQDRAARVRFDWDTIEPVIAKVREEIAELAAAPDDPAREQEVGDLLFAVVNWARWLGIDPEAALRGTNRRFYRRFRYIEQQVAAQDRPFEALTLQEMDDLWEAAKANGL
jgi:tetrapyrrole methylase family protein/MazG family protein